MSGTIRCQSSYNKKIIYLDSLRHFGRKDGQETYRPLREFVIHETPQLEQTSWGFFICLQRRLVRPTIPLILACPLQNIEQK